MSTTHPSERFALRFEADAYRRWIAGKEVILHCHHYNSRIQRTIESANAIDGRAIFVESAEAVFLEHLEGAVHEDDDEAERLEVARLLYSHLGYGNLDFTQLAAGIVVAPTSHFTEGWRAGFPDVSRPVCSLATGYIQAAIFCATGRLVYAREVSCALQVGVACEFRIDTTRTQAMIRYDRKQQGCAASYEPDYEEAGIQRSDNVDSQQILDALIAMPIHGNSDGLIPAFNVYLASTPADFYNIVCIRFLEEMTAAGFGEQAREQLIYDAETCGMNTFRGIMASVEWEALIAPMILEQRDTMFAIVAVSNALGWGKWHVRRYTEGKRLELVSRNGYEANGVCEWRGHASEPTCLMLTGVAAGIMQLVHGVGSLEERFGQYASDEVSCRATGAACCAFEVEASS